MNVPIFANQKIRVSYKTTENITLLLRGQVRLANGEIVDLSESKIVSGVTSGTVTSGTFEKTVPEGELIAHTIKTSTSNIQRGQCFLRGDVLYQADNFEAQALCAKYVTSESPVSLGQFEDSLSGRGYFRSIVGDDPLPGQQYEETANSNIIKKFLIVAFSLVTDANAANRKAFLVFSQNSDCLIGISAASQAASLTYYYTFGIGASKDSSSLVADKNILENMNPIFNTGLGVLKIAVENMQATDGITSIELFTEEWIKA